MRSLLALLVVLLPACVGARHAEVADFPAEGNFVRHLRLRIAPSHTKDFEALIASCVESATAADFEQPWLCYRESPGRYWLLWFAEEVPSGRDGLAVFTRHVARLSGSGEILQRLEGLEYTQEWNTTHRQYMPWCTVERMDPGTHPMARMMVRTVRAGEEEAFHDALIARTSFLAQQGYPLPVEGFVTLSGNPGTALQVVFPTDWVSFYGTNSFKAFVEALSPADKEAYAEIKASLMKTMSRAEFYDGQVLPELCYDPAASPERTVMTP